MASCFRRTGLRHSSRLNQFGRKMKAFERQPARSFQRSSSAGLRRNRTSNARTSSALSSTIMICVDQYPSLLVQFTLSSAPLFAFAAFGPQSTNFSTACGRALIRLSRSDRHIHTSAASRIFNPMMSTRHIQPRGCRCPFKR